MGYTGLEVAVFDTETVSKSQVERWFKKFIYRYKPRR